MMSVSNLSVTIIGLAADGVVASIKGGKSVRFFHGPKIY